ncbi:MAG: hypothetical protein LAQ30_29750 [Acidobacteriia bacterium]|nr:hypothetical protein [Terriglobia bacterium]
MPGVVAHALLRAVPTPARTPEPGCRQKRRHGRQECLVYIGLLLPLVAAAADFSAWSPHQQEHFLLTARILNERYAGQGLTRSEKAMLADGRHTHAAHIQTIDIYMPLFKGKDGSEEKDFRDSWKFNVAAYRLAELLRLTDMVPVCVERVVNGKPAAVDWWVDGVAMDEKRRKARGLSPPDVARWNRQMDTVRIFDQLIYNMDRSEENLLITGDWQVWMIDHTRAFRTWKKLRNPAAITHCTPELLERLKSLRKRDVEAEMGALLTPAEIDGLMARRDLIVGKLERSSIPQALVHHVQ